LEIDVDLLGAWLVRHPREAREEICQAVIVDDRRETQRDHGSLLVVVGGGMGFEVTAKNSDAFENARGE
jgi:hypothetical protein